eukprot:2797330-Amphidinium_carterae.1
MSCDFTNCFCSSFPRRTNNGQLQNQQKNCQVGRLLYLGAHWESCDANGTTCLHVACRAGAVPIVKVLATIANSQLPSVLSSLGFGWFCLTHVHVFDSTCPRGKARAQFLT